MAIVVAALAASTLAGAAHAQPDEGAAQQAAREITAAQDRANEAAVQWSQAEAELTSLQDEATKLEQEKAATQQQVDTLRTTVEKAAAERFMASGNGGIPILTGYQAPLDQLSAAELGRVAAGTSDQAFDQFDVAQRDLQRKADALTAKQAEVQQQRKKYERLSTTAAAEVEHLKEVEQKRLADEQVRLALEAQRREEQRRLAAQQAAEAAQHAAAEAQRAAEQQQAAAAAAQQAAQAQATQDAAQEAAKAAPAVTDVAQPPAPAGTDAPVIQALAEQPSSAPANPGMICPVQGPTAYGDTWGDGRPGGRHHEGVDMISPKGTPLVAVADGDARFWTNNQGALGVSLTADNGTRYYYGHLSAYEGSAAGSAPARSSATSAPPATPPSTTSTSRSTRAAGAPVNPYPYVRNAGC